MGEHFDYAIIDNEENENLLGYFSYSINWRTRTLYNFGLYSFSKNNPIIGIDIYRQLKQIIKINKIHRAEYSVISGNPVEKHYNKIAKHYGGKKFIFTDTTMDKYGNYHNDTVYGIIFNN